MKKLIYLFSTLSMMILLTVQLNAQDLSFSPPEGGYGGQRFTIPANVTQDNVQNFKKITRISIKHGKYIEQIRVTWLTYGGYRSGGAGGEVYGNWSHIDLQDGEYITRVSGTSGRFINSLAFHTNKRRIIGSFGQRDGKSFMIHVPSGQQVIGFHGRSGQLIDQFGLAYKTIRRAGEMTARVPWRANEWVQLQSKVNRLNLDVQWGSDKANAPIWMYTPNGSTAQEWMFVSAGNGYYLIKSRRSGLYLNVKMESRKSGAFIWQRPKTNAAAQLWKPIDAGNGYFYLQSKLSGLYLDVRGAGMNPQTEVWQHPLNRTDAQKWRMTRNISTSRPPAPTAGRDKVIDHRKSDREKELEWYRENGLDPQKGGG
ncbi:RICIN domain-containing protein [Flavilitoribacter nigricans]|uniref:Jacalin-type lectin domain-containing protein n=1 Tax=Flavilitoribacter nigricans (strain ATCC 23147 / DSM 23189 / NBRC 102662 / NCIMB 1420 / SS-2) TaxID=1122177 RepID=A0A2D0MZH5_FLAN2|nr:RICIN domain-containing protein [Flavilitoribacter nigricans]PHN01580.1 hypothetical protein CRP01_36385 [Flavilitoribacter nigricans DSM 23189 = NBRC 102662]